MHMWEHYCSRESCSFRVMKIQLYVTIELQVTEAANRVGSNEKVVWARLIGQISAPFLPREDETIWLNLLSEKTTDPTTVEYTKYVLNEKNVLEPQVHCVYCVPSDMDDGGEPVEERVVIEMRLLNETIIPNLKRKGFKVDAKTTYGHKAPPSI